MHNTGDLFYGRMVSMFFVIGTVKCKVGQRVSRGIEYMLFNREFVTINLKICSVSE